MSEPLEMSQARNIYSREHEHFRRELLNILRQYESRPMSFEIKQHIRLRALDMKQECLERYRRDTDKIECNQLPVIGNSLRIRSMCSSELPHTSRQRISSYRTKRMVRDDENVDDNIDNLDCRSSYTSTLRQSLPLNKLTYESTRRATKNSHVLAFEKQLLNDMQKIIDSIDYLNDANREEWLQPLKSNRGRHYFNSLYDDIGYSLPLYNSSNLLSLTKVALDPNEYYNYRDHNLNKTNNTWKVNHQKYDQKTEVEKFYDNYLSTSKYLNNQISNDDDLNNNNKSTTKASSTPAMASSSIRLLSKIAPKKATTTTTINNDNVIEDN